jgi:hypothetical protein
MHGDGIVTDCILTESPPYACLACGFGRDRVFLRPFHRNCPKAPENISRRKWRLVAHLSETLADKIGDSKYRTLDGITTVLDTYCANCDNFLGDRCKAYGGCDGQAMWCLTLKRESWRCKLKKWDTPSPSP